MKNHKLIIMNLFCSGYSSGGSSSSWGGGEQGGWGGGYGSGGGPMRSGGMGGGMGGGRGGPYQVNSVKKKAFFSRENISSGSAKHIWPLARSALNPIFILYSGIDRSSVLK